MKIGISTASFFGRKTTEDSLKVIQELGIDTCEMFLTTFREYNIEFAKLLTSRLNSLEVYSVHTLNQQFEPELFNSVQRTREDCEYFFTKVAKCAAELNAKFYTFHGPARLHKREYKFNFENLGKRLAELNEILYNNGNGCQLAYENVHWTYYSEPSFFEGLREHSNIKCCLDIKQAMQSKIDVYEYLKGMEGRLVNVHLCDYDENGKLCVPGKGIFDFVKLFKTLDNMGYDAPLMMELYSGDYENFDDIRRGYDFLNNCLHK